MSVVFYSWQSELPNNCNRGFIESSLERAAKAIAQDPNVEAAPRVDSDTQGVAGSPDIGATIFKKIQGASVFVADVSLINRGIEVRPTPNPNVLLELGFAYGKLGEAKIILVLNKHFGPVEHLPFDLKQKKVLVYSMDPAAESKAAERDALAKELGRQLKLMLEEASDSIRPAQPTSTQRVLAAIESGAGNRVALLRGLVTENTASVAALAPPSGPATEAKEQALLAGIDASTGIVREMAQVSEQIAAFGDEISAKGFCKSLAVLLQEYKRGPRTGQAYDSDYDLFRFVGYEVFVMFVAALVRHDRWGLLRLVFVHRFAVEGLNGAVLEPFSTFSHPVLLLAQRSKRLRRVAVHADLLQARHEPGGALSQLCSFSAFADADFLSALAAEWAHDGRVWSPSWRTFTLVYNQHGVPGVLSRAVDPDNANGLAVALGTDVDHLRRDFGEKLEAVRSSVPGDFKPTFHFDANSFGRA